jgi:hypothetical protein
MVSEMLASAVVSNADTKPFPIAGFQGSTIILLPGHLVSLHAEANWSLWRSKSLMRYFIAFIRYTTTWL